MLLHTDPSSGGASPAMPETVRLTPEFNGRAGEYFGIWIVNVLLGIVTLGVYSAWAKVRTERYFYGNTRLAGSAFEYLADPIRILKGRLIAMVFLVALALSLHFAPLLYFGLFLVLFLATPLLAFLTLRFRARYSAWRGVRFHFQGGAGAAYGPYMLWPILAAFTASLLYPVSVCRQHEYMVDGHRLGRERFRYTGEAGDYYGPYLAALGMGFVLIFVGVIAFGAMMSGLPTVEPGADAGARAGAANVAVIGTLVLYAAMFFLSIYVRTRYLNLLWKNARLGEHRFESTLRARDMFWIYVSNLFVVVCTLGLATPWAMVRLARYRAAHFAVLARGSIDAFVADLKADRASTGAEMVDVLDVGVDIGL